MTDFDIVYIKTDFFENNPNLQEILDKNDPVKQQQRAYLFLTFTYNNNNFFIPFRSNIKNCSFPLPTTNRPNAGLDYRKMLIINNLNYIVPTKHPNIPNSQLHKINNNKHLIKQQVINYINGYIKAFKKNRHTLDSRFIYSTLHNYHKELCLLNNNINNIVTFFGN